MSSLTLAQQVVTAVRTKLDADEPFTHACISHPIIEASPSVGHRFVKDEVLGLWRSGQLVDGNGVAYLRTPITVYPQGPSGPTAKANLYYPDNGYDPYGFDATSQILNRDDDDTTTITNTADGSTVTKQCSVQSVEKTLNVPRFLIKDIGWHSGSYVSVSSAGGIVQIRLDPQGAQKIDNEGRIRLHGSNVDALQNNSPTAFVVESSQGDKYIQISPTKSLPQTLQAIPAPCHKPSIPSIAGDTDETDDSKLPSAWTS